MSGLGFYFLPNATFPIQLVLPVVLVVILGVSILIDLSLRAMARAGQEMPNAIMGRASHLEGIALILFEPHHSFYIEQTVTLLSKDDQFEVQCGVGYVLNIQSDGKIQVVVSRDFSPDKSFWKTIKANNGASLKSLVVKPGVPKSLNDRLYENDFRSED